MECKAIYTGMKSIRDAVDKMGIAKADKALGDGVNFAFRGVDAVLDTFSGLLAAANVLVTPSYSDMSIDERPTRNSRTWHASVKGHFKAISLIDGSELEWGDFYGEANDTQDKAISKAQSISLRQAYLLTFCVPLGPDADPENGDSAGEDTRPPIDSGPKARADAPKQKGGKVAKGKAAAPVQQPAGKPLIPAQQKILDVKLRNCGASLEEVEKLLGRPVCSENFNDAMDIIQDLSKGGLE